MRIIPNGSQIGQSIICLLLTDRCFCPHYLAFERRDMALEIARVILRGSEVLDVGCGNGFIAHHLSAMLGTNVDCWIH